MLVKPEFHAKYSSWHTRRQRVAIQVIHILTCVTFALCVTHVGGQCWIQTETLNSKWILRPNDHCTTTGQGLTAGVTVWFVIKSRLKETQRHGKIPGFRVHNRIHFGRAFWSTLHGSQNLCWAGAMLNIDCLSSAFERVVCMCGETEALRAKHGQSPHTCIIITLQIAWCI